MKNKYFKSIIWLQGLFVLIFTLSSCDEHEFLSETPLDFYSTENSYVSYDNFNAAVIGTIERVRNYFYENDDAIRIFCGLSGITYPSNNYYPDYDFGSILLSTSDEVVDVWKNCYRIIYDANVIIERSDAAESELTAEEKAIIQAEALFLRAWTYKVLANLYGGVPIVLKETTEPKRDYTRATRKEVYEQCAEDLEFAVANLPGITEVEDLSRISNLAASHILSEIYISLERWSDAIAAADFVINDPAMALMTEGFGNKIENPEYLGFNDDPNFEGDVFWDLFFVGNQSRESGNTEAIWLIPMAYNVTGGGDGGPGVRCQVPRLWQLEVENNDGTAIKLIPHPNENYGGRGGGFSKPSPYFVNGLWAKSGSGDIRNAAHNIIRDWIVKNESSDYNGRWLVADTLPYAYESYDDTIRNFYPVIAKGSTFGSFPDELLIEDQSVPGSIGHTEPSKRNWKDHYAIRLAETYLLRAEAHLGNGNQALAADDINVLRARAQATPVAASEVDIDYILDERMRELNVESLHLCTTNRLGLTGERLRKNFPLVGANFQDHHNLWPIPYSEIEKNVEAVLEQNPEY